LEPENVFRIGATLIIVVGAVLFALALRRFRVLRNRQAAGEDVEADLGAVLYILVISGGFAGFALIGVVWVLATR
jgi:hypothetical protein